MCLVHGGYGKELPARVGGVTGAPLSTLAQRLGSPWQEPVLSIWGTGEEVTAVAGGEVHPGEDGAGGCPCW